MTDIVKEIREVALIAKMARVMDLMYRAAEEIERLRSVIDATANHWLALQHERPVKWEGAIDGAMEAACAKIVELDAFLVIANEQQVAVENENGKLREEVRRLRVEAGYD